MPIDFLFARPEISNTIAWWQPWLGAAVLNGVLLGFAWVLPKKLLTPAGHLHAWALGCILWATLGWRAYSVMMLYFLCGSAVTRIGMAEKEAAGIAEKRSGARGPENVWGSAATATVCALLAYGLTRNGDQSWVPLLILGYVASIATKLSDTSASEVGKAYGKTTYLITTLKSVPRGTEGAISLEGTIAGLLGSLVLAIFAYILGLISVSGVIICLVAALVATTIESLIGAAFQDQNAWLTNELVNFINTAIGAIVAIGLGGLVLGGLGQLVGTT
jgi:uncharacterized protein (TIGR00297 family)